MYDSTLNEDTSERIGEHSLQDQLGRTIATMICYERLQFKGVSFLGVYLI